MDDEGGLVDPTAGVSSLPSGQAHSSLSPLTVQGREPWAALFCSRPVRTGHFERRQGRSSSSAPRLNVEGALSGADVARRALVVTYRLSATNSAHLRHRGLALDLQKIPTMQILRLWRRSLGPTRRRHRF